MKDLSNFTKESFLELAFKVSDELIEDLRNKDKENGKESHDMVLMSINMQNILFAGLLACEIFGEGEE